MIDELDPIPCVPSASAAAVVVAPAAVLDVDACRIAGMTWEPKRIAGGQEVVPGWSSRGARPDRALAHLLAPLQTVSACSRHTAIVLLPCVWVGGSKKMRKAV